MGSVHDFEIAHGDNEPGRDALLRVQADRQVGPTRFMESARPGPLKRQLTITADPIDEPALLAERRLARDMGAVVCFLGFVRGDEQGQPIRALEYETFQRMAEHQFNLLFDDLQERWPVESVRLVHRIGVVRVNEPSLWVEIVAPHRSEAFAACQWLIDEMKRVVPIWKRPAKEV